MILLTMFERRLSGQATINRSDVTRTKREDAAVRHPVFYVLAAAAIIGWFYILFRSDLFLVNRVEVRGVRATDPLEVERETFSILDDRSSWRPWSTRHTWFIDVPRLEEKLRENLFAVNVTVDKPLFGVLRLKVEERLNRVIFYSHQQYVWLDLQGAVTADLSSDEKQAAQARILGQVTAASDDAPIIHRDLDDPLAPGYRVADATIIRRWIKTSLDAASLGLRYREMLPPEATSTVATFRDLKGYRVLVDTSIPLESQIRAYKAFEQMPQNEPLQKAIEYVDLRIPGKIFVK